MTKSVQIRRPSQQRVSRKLPRYRDSLAGRLLSAREAVMAPIRPILRAAGITEQQWRVLRVLIDDGTTDISTLSANSLLRPPSVTRILRELETRGLIQRILDPFDARRSIISISPIGRKLVDSTTEAMLEMLDKYAAAFGAERLGGLRSELALLIEAIGTPNFESSGDED